MSTLTLKNWVETTLKKRSLKSNPSKRDDYSAPKKAGLSALTGGLLLFLILLTSPLLCFSDESVLIKDVRHWENPDFVRFVFDLSTPVEFTSGRLSNPERLFFDLKNTKLSKGMKRSFEIKAAFVKSMRLGQYSADTARIVFDLQSPSYNFKVMNLEDSSRLVIDIYTGGLKKGKSDLRTETNPTRPFLR